MSNAPGQREHNTGGRAKQRAFLDAFERLGNVTAAARVAGISRQRHYQWLEEDDEYPQKFDEAYRAAIDELVAAARQRAIAGVVRKKFYEGQPIVDPETGKQYMEREYSDALLIFLLKCGGLNESEAVTGDAYKVYVNIDPEKV